MSTSRIIAASTLMSILAASCGNAGDAEIEAMARAPYNKPVPLTSLISGDFDVACSVLPYQGVLPAAEMMSTVVNRYLADREHQVGENEWLILKIKDSAVASEVVIDTGDLGALSSPLYEASGLNWAQLGVAPKQCVTRSSGVAVKVKIEDRPYVTFAEAL